MYEMFIYAMAKHLIENSTMKLNSENTASILHYLEIFILSLTNYFFTIFKTVDMFWLIISKNIVNFSLIIA